MLRMDNIYTTLGPTLVFVARGINQLRGYDSDRRTKTKHTVNIMHNFVLKAVSELRHSYLTRVNCQNKTH